MEQTNLFLLEYKMKSDIQSCFFKYELYEELYQDKRMEFINGVTGEVLTLEINDISYFKTKPLRINEN